MIEIWNGFYSTTLDNKDPEVCRVTSIELKAVEEVAGCRIEKLSSAQIRSCVSFINVD